MPTAGTSPTIPLLRITVPRRIEASPEEVFDAWAEPDLFRRWFEPHRAILRKAAVDELWYWEADHAGRLWAHYCRYLRVERPRLLTRKSTRLNSSHLVISYAVFCFKKKYDL